ncbi:hypothetical protein ACLK1T_14465 [Escherichia coli]
MILIMDPLETYLFHVSTKHTEPKADGNHGEKVAYAPANAGVPVCGEKLLAS